MVLDIKYRYHAVGILRRTKQEDGSGRALGHRGVLHHDEGRSFLFRQAVT